MNKSTVSILLLGVLLLGGLFLVMRPAPQSAAKPTELQTRQFEFNVIDGQLAEGPVVVAVTEGTPVTFRFFTNKKDEVHLHGYDLSAELKPDEASQISFVADKSGRFEMELHKSHSKLSVLEVRPH